MILPLKIARNSTDTLQAQLFNQVRGLILSGRLSPGMRIPASRVLARQHGLSRNTVTQAYDRLISEGYLETARGLGTRVSSALPDTRLQTTRDLPLGESDSGTRPHTAKTPVLFRGRSPLLPETGIARAWVDFWPGRPNRRHFPLRAWRQLMSDRLTNAGATLSEYGDPAGVSSLREAVAAHLKSARGMDASPDRVLITAGSQEGLNIVARLFVKPGTPVLVENPCYQGAALTLESFGAVLEPIDVDPDGIRIELIERRRAPLAYVTPSHQFPTGVTLTLERRLRLLNWAREVGAYVVEDDYNSDYRYAGPPLVALAGLDLDGDSVIYLGTLSKSLGAGLRTGFMVLPEVLVEPARTVKTLLNYGQPWLEQIVAADFLSSGGYQRHLRRVLRDCEETRDCLLESLARNFGPEPRVSGIDGGMHVMWRLPSDFPIPEELAAATRRHGVRVHTVTSAGAVNFNADIARDALILGYAALSENEVRAGITGIMRALDDITARRGQSDGTHG